MSVKKQIKEEQKVAGKEAVSYLPYQNQFWKIRMGDIPPQNFKSFKFYNDQETIIFETEFTQTEEYLLYDYKKLFNIESFDIEYLDNTLLPIEIIEYQIKGLNFENICDYSKTGLNTIKLKLIIE